MSDLTESAEARILAEFASLRAYLEANLVGRTIDGVFYPGALPQIADLTRRVLALEHRKVWWRDQGLPVLVSLSALCVSAWSAFHGK